MNRGLALSIWEQWGACHRARLNLDDDKDYRKQLKRAAKHPNASAHVVRMLQDKETGREPGPQFNRPFGGGMPNVPPLAKGWDKREADFLIAESVYQAQDTLDKSIAIHLFIFGLPQADFACDKWTTRGSRQKQVSVTKTKLVTELAQVLGDPTRGSIASRAVAETRKKSTKLPHPLAPVYELA